MQRSPCLLLLAAMLIPSLAIGAAMSPELESRLDAARADEPIPVIVNLADRVDLAQYTGGRATAPALITDLHAAADRSQPALIQWLDERGGSGEVRRFWITNTIALEAVPSVVRDLAAHPAVLSVDLDAPIGLPPFEMSPGSPLPDPEWNIDLVGAPAVWADLGLTGEGIVIGSMDSGVDIAHPALVGKWRGGDNSWIDIINGEPSPYDDNGHGTHTTGTMVGGDGPGPFDPDVGIAPGATFIAAKILDETGHWHSYLNAIAGAEFMLDPDGDPATDDFPHIINNSWCGNGPLWDGFYSTIAVWRAAGIIPVFAIGNFGPNPGTTYAPGNYNNTIGVGATEPTDEIAIWSSRGPSPSGEMFPDDLRKPDFSAPGAQINSCWLDGGYLSGHGTSAASPHIAGTVALMLQARPTLTYDEIYDLLVDHVVDLGSPGYDYDFGYGRLDTWAVVNAVITSVPARPMSAIASLQPCRPNPFNPQTTISYTLPTAGHACLQVFDLRGRLIATLIDEARPSGSHEAAWNGRDDHGLEMPSGVYLSRLEAGGRVVHERMMLVK